jgi:hypothetical protein
LIRLAAVLALGAGAFIASNVLAGGPNVGVGSLTRGVGQQGQVALEVTDVTELGAWTVDVSYDPSIISLVDCEAEEGGLCNPAYRDNMLRTNGVAVRGLDGDVLLATIDIACENVGTSELAVSLSVFADTTPGGPQPISANISNGSVTCTSEPQPQAGSGDVDCDGDVDSIDAVLVLQYDAGLIDTLPCFENADLNGDGDVNAIDGTIILQIAAGLI